MQKSPNPAVREEGTLLLGIHDQIRAADQVAHLSGQRLRDGNANNFFIPDEPKGRIQIIDQGERPEREMKMLDRDPMMDYRGWNDSYLSRSSP